MPLESRDHLLYDIFKKQRWQFHWVKGGVVATQLKILFVVLQDLQELLTDGAAQSGNSNVLRIAQLYHHQPNECN